MERRKAFISTSYYLTPQTALFSFQCVASPLRLSHFFSRTHFLFLSLTHSIAEQPVYVVFYCRGRFFSLFLLIVFVLVCLLFLLLLPRPSLHITCPPSPRNDYIYMCEFGFIWWWRVGDFFYFRKACLLLQKKARNIRKYFFMYGFRKTFFLYSVVVAGNDYDNKIKFKKKRRESWPDIEM